MKEKNKSFCKEFKIKIKSVLVTILQAPHLSSPNKIMVNHRNHLLNNSNHNNNLTLFPSNLINNLNNKVSNNKVSNNHLNKVTNNHTNSHPNNFLSNNNLR